MTRTERPRTPGGAATASRDAYIVVCEDDGPTLELLCEHLVADRFNVLPATSAVDALHLCRGQLPDLLLLDLTLPDDGALEVLREIREPEPGSCGLTSPDLPVIVLSGQRSKARRARALELGADADLVKPYAYAELRTRISLLLRRGPSGRSRTLQIGKLAIDLCRREVSIDGRPVELPSREYELLVVLAGDPCRVFSKLELLGRIWGPRSATQTRTLDSHAARLRRKVSPEGRSLVINCWGVGYRLCDGLGRRRGS